MTRSIRMMFLTLIAALLAGYLLLHSRNESLANQLPASLKAGK